MLTKSKGVFGPDDLNNLQDSFDDAWAQLVASHFLADADEAKRARARLARIILRLYSGNDQRMDIVAAAAATDIWNYIATIRGFRPVSHSKGRDDIGP